MTDLLQKLLPLVNDLDKADLVGAHNGRIAAQKAYQAKPGRATADDLEAARSLFEGTLERLGRQYLPGQMPKPVDAGGHFANRTEAFSWYTSEGGQLQKRAFYDKVPRIDARRVSRLAVSEMLRKERITAAAPVDLSERIEQANLRRAEAEANIKARQDEREAREMDAQWVRRENADEEICVWTARLRDATAYHIGRQLLAIIHACGGQAGRLSEVQALVDEALAAACNEIAHADEVTVEIEDLEATA